MESRDWPLQELTAADRSLLEEITEARILAPGTEFIRAGEPSGGLFLLASGEAEVRLPRGGSSRVAPGAILGEMSLVSGEPASAAVVTLGECRVAFVAQDDLAARCAADAGFSARLHLGLARLIGERLRTMNAALAGGEGGAVEAASWADDLVSVRGVDLPRFVLHWIARYAAIGQRGTFAWKWCWRGIERAELPCLDPAWREHTRCTKLLLLVLWALLEDLADRPEGSGLFEQAAALVTWEAREATASVELEIRLARDLWQMLRERIGELPRAAELGPLLEFDMRQVANGLRHQAAARRFPLLENPAEATACAGHRLSLIPFATLDLMGAAELPAGLGAVREVVWHAQNWGRVGTDLAIWRRDLADGLQGGRLIGTAVDRGLLAAGSPLFGDPAALTAHLEAAGLEAEFMTEAREHRQRMLAASQRVEAMDMGPYTSGVRSYFAAGLATRGYL